MTSWYTPLASLSSLGSQHAGPGSLAGLHRARAEHLSQFFTPDEVAGLLWRIVSPAMDAAARSGRVALLDNSVGSARLLQFADPEKHTLSGFDVHAPSIAAVEAAAQSGGFVHDFMVAGMEEVRPRGYGVALINPPFSIRLESPLLEPYDCCSFGKFGPATSCLSHAYAVAQALDAAGIVAAVLPLSFAETLRDDPSFSQRLRYVAKLPHDSFESEGASVATAIAVWGDADAAGDFVTEVVEDPAHHVPPALDLRCRNSHQSAPSALSRGGVHPGSPTITTPVTGENGVRIVRHNRRIILKFACGLMEAKVLNAVLRNRVDAHLEEHRYPRSVEFSGQGILDIECHLTQPDPVASFQALLDIVASQGGRSVTDAGILGYLRRAGKRVARHRIPLAHAIFAAGAAQANDTTMVVANAPVLIKPGTWSSPIVKKGERLVARRVGGGRWSLLAAGVEWPMTDEQLGAKFTIEEKAEASWVKKFKGRSVDRPDLARQAKARAKKLGIHKWLTWGYQMADLVELVASPYSCVVGWEMGLGKTRLAIALCLMHTGKRHLIVTEAHLVPEVMGELRALKLAQGSRAIESAEDARDLRQINVISYNRLRQPVNRARPKLTYAKLLRRRISIMVCDEGHCLRNLNSEQTRAAWNVCARRRYIFTGTVVANYPRDTLAMMAWVAGSGTAIQPYGVRGDPFMEERLVRSMSKAVRGADAYCEHFVTLEWVTHEFREEMQDGAKREVPKINNLPKYRDWLAPLVKRRLAHEPEVAKYIAIPSPTEIVNEVEWNSDHLAFYTRVADGFAQWYRDTKRDADRSGHNVNLVALLARIGAVETACNYPQAGLDGFGSLGGLTSKHEHAIARVAELAAAGHKTIVYAKSPALIELLGRELGAQGIQCVMLHGGRDIVSRTKDLNDNFRNGPAPVLLATLGCTQTGLNISQADRVIFLSRDWTAKTERQAKARVLRPQQKRDVTVEYIHLPGSIDCYQAQLVRWKGDAADTGLDWAAPTTDGEEFLHLDHILGQFVAGVAALRGTKAKEVRGGTSPPV